jgi:transcriptional regulator with XRE-family HTH domain
VGKIDYRPTGSKLLGSELRRLRGSRTLGDISRLSQSDAFGGRIRSIAEPTLSQIENGISMPTLDSLQTLATVYGVSAQHLLNLIAEERLAASADLPETQAELRQAWLDKMTQGRGVEALALAIHGERTEADREARLSWRVSRARSMAVVGMRLESIAMLLDVVNGSAGSADLRSRARRYLVQALQAAGYVATAREQIAIAQKELDDQAPVSERVSLLQTHIRLNVLAAELGADR